MVVELTRSQIHLLAPEVFDSESDPSELDRIELFDFVVKLSFWVLEGAHDEPETVDRLFLGVCVSVLDVKALYVPQGEERV